MNYVSSSMNNEMKVSMSAALVEYFRTGNDKLLASKYEEIHDNFKVKKHAYLGSTTAQMYGDTLIQ